jgi:NAD(P)-dependent dehydrogenase (short-subunit alcohol dehydrogenase family)
MTSRKPPLISTGALTRESLRGRVAVVSGAGDGIGFEAARALAWLGAHVVIAELDKRKGRKAEQLISAEMGTGTVTFSHTDVGDDRSIARMTRSLLHSVGKADIVVNNATLMTVGSVQETAIRQWDRGYRVNVRGPVLLAQAFLPGMLMRKYGVFVCVSSPGVVTHMGAYQVFKSAQVELARTLAAELEESGVYVLNVAPGSVPTTPGASSAIAKAAALYGKKSAAESGATVQDRILSAEVAGASLAAAVALASEFCGQEITSMQALQAAEIIFSESSADAGDASTDHS